MLRNHERAAGQKLTLFTIGHSNRSLEALIAMLRAHGITRLVDIRTIPRSRHNPQFNRETLPAALAAAGIAYEHRKGLGGLRRPRTDSPNSGLAQRGLPRLRRLHGDGGVRGRARGPRWLKRRRPPPR